MRLSPGSRVGPYEVLSSLGEGGMGQVYRARDPKLGRDVAIKILPEFFLTDADRLARFEREARTLASLNHPNIAQIYEMEGSEQSHALVMELVEGEDLSTIISRGPVPIADALPIAQQIALALEAAHDLGIVHRDLKPANVKVRADGTVKVLDFGLAKAMDPAGADSGSLANSPTMTSPATAMGMILGTAAYMSPEQARGKPVDKRADVWAFGVVLFEMLTGRRAFEGNEVSDVLASVLKDSVALDTLPAETPPAIRRLLRRCLVKNRADRLDSMATARLEIADAATAGGDAPDARSAIAAPPAASGRSHLWLALAGVLAGLVAGWLLFRSPASNPAGEAVRFTIAVPPEMRLTAVAVSDDTVFYEGDRLYVRRLAETDARPVPGTEGGRNLFLSHDGRWLGFFQGGKIRKVAIAGGDSLPIADVDPDSPGAAWTPRNTVLFSPGWSGPVYSVPADGGKPAAISTIDTAAGELAHWWPEPLPGGKIALITVWMAGTGINDAKLAALDLDTGKHRVLMPGAAARYLSSGHVLFFRAGGYYTVSFDPVTAQSTGEPVKVLPDALALDPLGTRIKPIAVSRAGTLVYIAGPLVPEVQLAWATAAGAIEPVPGPPRRWSDVKLSPDGRQVAVWTIEGGLSGIGIFDLARQTSQKLELAGAGFAPVWTPDGSLLFTSMRKGHFDVDRWNAADGTARSLLEEPLDQQPVAVTHDGKRVVLIDYLADSTITFSVSGFDRVKDRTRLQLKASGTDEPRLSPDDKWLAARVMDSGRGEVIVTSFPGPGPTVHVSARGGRHPIWSAKGSTLYYQRDDDLMAATYSTAGGRFTIERETPLFKLAGHDLVGLAPDGRFLLVRNLPGQQARLQVAVNWLAELKK
jgi:serine/threonine-protein kinase